MALVRRRALRALRRAIGFTVRVMTMRSTDLRRYSSRRFSDRGSPTAEVPLVKSLYRCGFFAIYVLNRRGPAALRLGPWTPATVIVHARRYSAVIKVPEPILHGLGFRT